MSKRENIKTTIEEIVAYWSEHEDESGLSVDFSEDMNVAGDVVIKESRALSYSSCITWRRG